MSHVDDAGRLRALKPRHLLFLCVANSARSQIAEGVARALAPPDVRISSAGSEPTSVRPEALSVLREIGVDASAQRSKAVDEIEGPVDAVITLCAEEACPAWLGDALRLHWPLPDPAGDERPAAGAAVEGSAAEAATDEAGAPDPLRRYREVRDELVRRLREVFPEGRLSGEASPETSSS